MTTVEETIAELQTEVAKLRDHIAISQVIASYGPLVDTSDGLERSTVLAELWTDDGVYDIGAIGKKVGKREIAENFQFLHFDMVRSGVAHVMGLPFIEVDGDTATALCYSQVMVPENDRWFAWRVSANLWELERTPAGWKVGNRVNRLVRDDGEAYGLQKTIDRLHTGTRG
jgi:transposase